jgi:Gpi18-like mannosyltransferase
VTVWNAENGLQVAYPPLFCYQEAAMSKIAEGRLDALHDRYPVVAEVWRRVWFKLLPIGYDLLTGLVMLFFLARFVPPPWPLVGAAAYLLNPGIFIDSAVWGQTESLLSFFLLLVILCLIQAVTTERDAWFWGAWAMAALAIGQKLQGIMVLPLLAVVTLMRRRAALAIACGTVFLLVVAVTYGPFLLAKRWDYFESVFVASFTWFPFTQINAFNFWALGYVASSHAGIGGVSYAQIGLVLYLASLTWLGWWLFRVGLPRNDPRESARMFLLAAVYACVAPFMVLTRMHERYIAPAIAFLVVAACLDRRLRWLAVGFSVTYALNLLYVLRSLEPVPPEELAIRNASQFALRVFCSLLNITFFGWLTVKLPGLLVPGSSEQVASGSVPSE